MRAAEQSVRLEGGGGVTPFDAQFADSDEIHVPKVNAVTKTALVSYLYYMKRDPFMIGHIAYLGNKVMQ